MFFWTFCKNLCLLVFHILIPTFSSKEVDIDCYRDDDAGTNFSEVIENCLIVINKEDSKEIDRDSPKNRSNHVIKPEFSFCHTTWSRNKRYKRSSKIMKFAEDDIPESVFLELFVKNLLFSKSQTKIVTIFVNNLFAIPFPNPVSQIVSKHSSEDGKSNSSDEVSLAPKSADENHDIHTGYSCSNNRKWLNTGTGKCDEIVPIANYLNKFAKPLDSILDPFRMKERNSNNDKSQNEKSKCDDFCQEDKNPLEGLLHVFKIQKKPPFARENASLLSKYLCYSIFDSKEKRVYVFFSFRKFVQPVDKSLKYSRVESFTSAEFSIFWRGFFGGMFHKYDNIMNNIQFL